MKRLEEELHYWIFAFIGFGNICYLPFNFDDFFTYGETIISQFGVDNHGAMNVFGLFAMCGEIAAMFYAIVLSFVLFRDKVLGIKD